MGRVVALGMVIAVFAFAITERAGDTEVQLTTNISKVNTNKTHPRQLTHLDLDLPDLTFDLAGWAPDGDAAADLTSAATCDLTSRGGAATCTANGTSCGEHGRCACGRCRCQAGWAGSRCQCQASLCRRLWAGSVPCDGPDRGVCVCDSCLCRPGWAGLFCDCPLSEDGCRPATAASRPVCSGRGSCVCGRCVDCRAPFGGRFCQRAAGSRCAGRLGRCLRCRLAALGRGGGAGRCRSCASSPPVLLVQDELRQLSGPVRQCAVPVGRGCRVPVLVQRTRHGRRVVRVAATDLLCAAAEVASEAAVTPCVAGLVVGVTLGLASGVP